MMRARMHWTGSGRSGRCRSDDLGDGPGRTVVSDEVRPWAALWALCLGFFMILVDTTIVAVALPVLRTSLDTDIGSVM